MGSTVFEAYRKANPASERLFHQARQVIPGGLTHDIRYMKPFPIYVDRAAGSRKWSVDGQELVDYWMGHGALFLGHVHPEIMRAVAEQAARGTHYGACHAVEVRWAELVRKLVPCAERVRFTMSGTEATHLALRLARAYTGRSKVLKFAGHFHGWHDGVMAAVKPPYEIPVSIGVPEGTLGDVVVCTPNDLEGARALLRADGQIGAVILEPAGGSSGMIPTDAAFLRGLREATAEAGAVLIFDEVISGFRYAPGGAQEVLGVIPDMTTLAKIVAGGLPGGAVVGKAAILDLLAFRDDPEADRKSRVAHAGTYNANPLSAAAGISMLQLIADGEAHKRANRAGEILRARLNEAIARVGVQARVYGDASFFHVYLGPWPIPEGAPASAYVALQKPPSMDAYHALRCAMVLSGVDIPSMHGWISAVHSDEDLHRTAAAFEASLRILKADGFLS